MPSQSIGHTALASSGLIFVSHLRSHVQAFWSRLRIPEIFFPALMLIDILEG